MKPLHIKIGIIGGSGLDDADVIKNPVKRSIVTPFGSPSSDLLCGSINGVDCVLLARHGPKHTITPSNVNYKANVWALKEVGCTHILASTACGSLQDDIRPGDIVFPDSFIDLTRKRDLTFFDGQHFEQKVVHIPMKPAFCEETRELLKRTAAELGLRYHPSGTVVVVEGPRFSSYAESNLYRLWGAHLVNMTLVPEVILAKELGLCYAAVAVATDYDCWHETEGVVCVNDVLEVMRSSVQNVIKLFINAITHISQKDWEHTIHNLQKTVVDSHQNK